MVSDDPTRADVTGLRTERSRGGLRGKGDDRLEVAAQDDHAVLAVGRTSTGHPPIAEQTTDCGQEGHV